MAACHALGERRRGRPRPLGLRCEQRPVQLHPADPAPATVSTICRQPAEVGVDPRRARVRDFLGVVPLRPGQLRADPRSARPPMCVGRAPGSAGTDCASSSASPVLDRPNRLSRLAAPELMGSPRAMHVLAVVLALDRLADEQLSRHGRGGRPASGSPRRRARPIV